MSDQKRSLETDSRTPGSKGEKENTTNPTYLVARLDARGRTIEIDRPVSVGVGL